MILDRGTSTTPTPREIQRGKNYPIKSLAIGCASDPFFTEVPLYTMSVVMAISAIVPLGADERRVM